MAARPRPTICTPATWRNSFIAWLANRNGWTKGAELGVWKGDTYLHVLEHCPQLTLYGVDLWEPQPGHAGPEDWSEWDHEAHEARVRDDAKAYGERAVILKMKTSEAAAVIPNSTLDFVFIDADHSSAGVRSDIEDWLPKLKQDGWMIGHDIDWPTVRVVVEDMLPGYEVGPNVVWFRPLNPQPSWSDEYK